MPSLKLLGEVSPVSKLWYRIQLNHSLEFVHYLFHRTSDWLMPRETRKAIWKMLPWIAKDKAKREKEDFCAEQERIIPDPRPHHVLLPPFHYTQAHKYDDQMQKLMSTHPSPPKNVCFPYWHLNGAIPYNKKVHLVLSHGNDVLNPTPMSVHWFFRRSEV